MPGTGGDGGTGENDSDTKIGGNVIVPDTGPNVSTAEITDEERLISGEIGKVCDLVKMEIPQDSVLVGVLDDMKECTREILEDPKEYELVSDQRSSVRKGRYNSHQRLDYVLERAGDNRSVMISIEKLRDTHPDANLFLVDMQEKSGIAMNKEDRYYSEMQQEMQVRKDQGKDFFTNAQRIKKEVANLYYAPTESVAISLMGEDGRPKYGLIINNTLSAPYVLLVDYTSESREDRFATKMPVSLYERWEEDMFTRVKRTLLSKCKGFRTFEN